MFEKRTILSPYRSQLVKLMHLFQHGVKRKLILFGARDDAIRNNFQALDTVLIHQSKNNEAPIM